MQNAFEAWLVILVMVYALGCFTFGVWLLVSGVRGLIEERRQRRVLKALRKGGWLG